MELNEFIVINNSNIDRKFYGAFARVNIEADVCIGQYKGKLVNVNESLSDYKHSVGNDDVIDAIDFLSCHGRYINDSIIEDENVRMKVNYKKKVIDIITTRKINKNEELLTDYGPDYWEGKAASMHEHDLSKEFSVIVAENKKRKRKEVESSLY